MDNKREISVKFGSSYVFWVSVGWNNWEIILEGRKACSVWFSMEIVFTVHVFVFKNIINVLGSLLCKWWFEWDILDFKFWNLIKVLYDIREFFESVKKLNKM